jgi:hypothetical protein
LQTNKIFKQKNMKKLFILLSTVFLFVTATAQVSNGIPVAQKGDFDLGIMIGIPPVADAKTPTFSVDGSWVIMSGFINTNTFGRNGAIDLGVYYGITFYGGSGWTTVQNSILFRPSFHFQFLNNLDTYGGILLGANIWATSIDEGDNHINTHEAIGPFLGAKYYFTNSFAVKLELATDIINGDVPILAAGISLKF